jgi:prepilin-type N-terminal cleavage/methylation domain-containing protein
MRVQSPRRSRSNRGFTLIEMTAVVFLIALFAVGVMIRLSASASGQALRDFQASLRAAAEQARLRAISTRTPVTLAVSSDQSAIEMRQSLDGQDRTVKSLRLPEGLTPSLLEYEGVQSSASEWRLSFYPDGTSDSGGIEFSSSRGGRFAWIASIGSAPRLVEGEMPSTGDERWLAGEMEQRGGG